MNILTSNEYNNCMENIEKIVNLINTINYDNALNDLQYINNILSNTIKNYGIYNFNYLLDICLGYNFKLPDGIHFLL